MELGSLKIDGRFVFVKARCKNTDAILHIGTESVTVKKTYIILVVAVLDFIAVIVFAIGLAL